ncbi:MAG: FliG C-terminal domain-containing protein [Pirellulaceae bacterium]|nr:FliG C-terminal domain-containing protein [Pirellulaceae bacterium]
MTPNRLRQIAILVDSLDTLAADRLLDQLPETLQQRVRDAVMDLDSVSDSERQTVLAEFRRGAAGGETTKLDRVVEQAEPKPTVTPTYQPAWRTTMPSATMDRSNYEPRELSSSGLPRDSRRSTPQLDAIERDPSLSFSRQKASLPEPAQSAPPPNSDLSETLASVDVETLASVVLRESPQILAAVLSLLPPRRAAQLLEFCPPALQSAALQRLHYLEELEDEVVHLLQQELSLVIRQRIKLKQKQRVGSQALAEIMVAAQQLNNASVTKMVRAQLQGEPATVPHQRPQTPSISRGLASAEPTTESQDHAERWEEEKRGSQPMADRLASNELEQATALADFEPRQTFAELVNCEAASLQALLATAKPQLTLLALRGASQALLDRVLKMLPRNEAKEVQFRVQNLGPTRVQDIQQAQQYLLRLASLLEDMGRFRRPRVRARSAA